MKPTTLEKIEQGSAAREDDLGVARLAGICRECLIINLPRSPKAAIVNFPAVWSVVPHASEKNQGATGL